MSPHASASDVAHTFPSPSPRVLLHHHRETHSVSLPVSVRPTYLFIFAFRSSSGRSSPPSVSPTAPPLVPFFITRVRGMFARAMFFFPTLVYYQSGKLSKLHREFIRTPRVTRRAVVKERKRKRGTERGGGGLTFLCGTPVGLDTGCSSHLSSNPLPLRNLGKVNRVVAIRINKPDRLNEMNCVRLIPARQTGARITGLVGRVIAPRKPPRKRNKETRNQARWKLPIHLGFFEATKSDRVPREPNAFSGEKINITYGGRGKERGWNSFDVCI